MKIALIFTPAVTHLFITYSYIWCGCFHCVLMVSVLHTFFYKKLSYNHRAERNFRYPSITNCREQGANSALFGFSEFKISPQTTLHHSNTHNKPLYTTQIHTTNHSTPLKYTQQTTLHHSNTHNKPLYTTQIHTTNHSTPLKYTQQTTLHHSNTHNKPLYTTQIHTTNHSTPLKYTHQQYFKNIFKNGCHFVGIFYNAPPLLTKS